MRTSKVFLDFKSYNKKIACGSTKKFFDKSESYNLMQIINSLFLLTKLTTKNRRMQSNIPSSFSEIQLEECLANEKDLYKLLI